MSQYVFEKDANVQKYIATKNEPISTQVSTDLKILETLIFVNGCVKKQILPPNVIPAIARKLLRIQSVVRTVPIS